MWLVDQQPPRWIWCRRSWTGALAARVCCGLCLFLADNCVAHASAVDAAAGYCWHCAAVIDVVATADSAGVARLLRLASLGAQHGSCTCVSLMHKVCSQPSTWTIHTRAFLIDIRPAFADFLAFPGTTDFATFAASAASLRLLPCASAPFAASRCTV